MSVELGFETIGNATVTIFDHGKPIITTDPWIVGSPYFGSWTHKYNIPEYQKENILNAKYVWLSHGHPDHLDIESLNLIRLSKILIPDHFGNRIYKDLKEQGFDVNVIESNCAMKLSDNIRIRSFADYNQDAALLIDIAGKDLIVNLNDGSLLGIKHTVIEEIKKYKNRFLLKLVGASDADMVNIYDVNGNFVNHDSLLNNKYIGLRYSKLMDELGCNYAIPFSSFHQYQREDSVHMNQYIKPIDDHYIEFDKSKGSLLPGFIIWNTEISNYAEIKPQVLDVNILPASSFGDSWSDNLESKDIKLLEDYFLRLETIHPHFGILHFNCGGKIHSIKLSNSKNEIQFEVPRNSLINAVRYRVFDDLLIGNFMKTTLINFKSLYPYFSPYVAKYSDNGGASNRNDFKNYIKHYYNTSESKYHFTKQRIIEESIKKIRYEMKDTSAFYFTRYIYRLLTSSPHFNK